MAEVRDWRAPMLEAVEAGEWAPKTINNARTALLGCFRMAVEDGLMAHNPMLDVRPLPVEFAERPYLTLSQINDYLDCCAPHYRPLAALLTDPRAGPEPIGRFWAECWFPYGEGRRGADRLARRTTEWHPDAPAG